MTTSPEPPTPGPARRVRRVLRWTAVGAAFAGLTAVGWLAGGVAASAGTLPEGLLVGGVAVGGLSVAEAEARVRTSAAPPRSIRLALPGTAEPLRVDVRPLEPRPIVRETLERQARGNGWTRRLRAQLGLAAERRVPLTYALDPEATTALVRRVSRRADRAPRPATVRRTPDGFPVTPGVAGVTVRRTALRTRLSGLPDELEVPVREVPPAVSTAAARTASARAASITAAPATVAAAGRRIRLQPALLRRAVTFTPGDDRIEVGFDPEVLRPALRRGFGPVERPPRPARLVPRGRTVTIVPSVNGRQVNAALVARSLATAAPGEIITARLRPAPPEFTTAAARRLRVRELISEFRTEYQCCPPRVTNIRRAAEILNGTIIPAGARFSLNEALGERTTDRGFVAAPQINAGRLEDAVGGGVSQIATTVFNAAFFAGLRLDTFTPHEFWISRYPPGREATISWGGPELVFTNDWPAAVLLAVAADDDGVTVRMYSSLLKRRIETETDLPGGSGAFTATFSRRVFRDQRKTRDERFSWRYRPAPAT